MSVPGATSMTCNDISLVSFLRLAVALGAGSRGTGNTAT